MANLSYTKVALTGATVTPVAAGAGGDVVPANERGFVIVTNGGASPITATVVTPGSTKFGSAEPDIAVVVPAGASRYIGPMTSALVDIAPSAPDGVQITYSAVTSVTVAAVVV